MATTSPKQPKLGGLYERKIVVERVYGDGSVVENYKYLRFEGRLSYQRVGGENGWGDPLLLWDITRSEVDPDRLHYHFLWKGKRKIYATLEEDEDFFEWFEVWWKLEEPE